MKTRLSIGFLLAMFAGSMAAPVPSVISYQGRVQANGTNFSGTGQFKFALVSPGTNVSRQATATATVTAGFVTGITVTESGGGYVGAPAVTITDATGTGAAAVAQVSGGVVTNISIQNAGSGYSAAAMVTIAPPPVTIVHGTFWSNDGTSSAGSEPGSAVPVAVQQGLFTVFLGDTNLPNMQPVLVSVFNQEDVRLRIWFRDGTNAFAQLSPDQRLGSVGYAIKAAFVSEGGVSGAALATGAVTTVTIENGAILIDDLSASLLNGAFWNLSGNSGTTPGTHFLGTTDNQALEFKVNGMRALRLEPNADNQPNVVGGSALNFVAPGIVGATIAGGGTEHENGGAGVASTNSVIADYGSIGGGLGNRIAAYRSTIAGGQNNHIGARLGTIGGGFNNSIATANNDVVSTIAGGGFNTNSGSYNFIGGGQNNNLSGSYSSVGGGRNNKILNANAATVAGGEENEISTNAVWSAIGGGGFNSVGNDAVYATIPGGAANAAAGDYSFAAGSRAKANHAGAFVWADASNFGDTPSTNAHSVTMRAAGGYRLFSNTGRTLGVYLAPNGGSWTSISDRNAKENFEPVNARGVLDKVAALPVSIWNYKSQTNGVRHIGPMAQDFKAAFSVGESDTGITTVDADGVALAAIQGLNQKLQEELNRRDAENAELKQRLEALERIILKSN